MQQGRALWNCKKIIEELQIKIEVNDTGFVRRKLTSVDL